jgi:hypothetical protein
VTALVALVSLVAAVAFAVAFGPIAALIPLLVGGIVAIRLGYSNQAKAIGGQMAQKASTPATGPGPSPDVSEQLRKLKGLLDDGLISVGEYEAKKAELLARI